MRSADQCLRQVFGEAPVCGNGELSADEECDDGNRDGDSCDSACRVEFSTTPAWHSVVDMHAETDDCPGMLEKN